MVKTKKETIVISLGGSLIVPDSIDTKFLKSLKQLISNFTKKGNKVILVCGGGSTARKYQSAAKKVSNLSHKELDWVGIYSTWLNARFVKTIFKDLAYKEIITNPTKKVIFKKVLIAAGWKPGFSTDTDAVLLAKTFNAKTLINMSNISHVYDKDPKKHKNAKLLKEISWKSMKEIVGSKWSPGANFPFDPIATKKASNLKLNVIIIGKNTNNLKKVLEKKKWKGTIIS